ncbi:MAG: 2-dehydropantoate 2-reductase [Halomonadaceae bacterium]|nr:MAG: 2-dehydropantoate 2-reductase [Halomonadaceae bacterium]
MALPPRIVIFGAGSVGGYIGGRLLAAGADLVMVGRPKLAEQLAEHPLKVSDLNGFATQVTVTPSQFVTHGAAALAAADLVLVAVKSAATREVGATLAASIRPGVPVVSLQNGVSNSQVLQEQLPDNTALAGMVPFNILQKAPGHFHQGTFGHLMASSHPLLIQLQPLFEKAGLALELREDMSNVLWSKLLLNLNNPINALSGLPLKEELSQRPYRRCLAMAQRETLGLLKQAGIATIRLTPLPATWLPTLMSSPDFLFTRLAKNMLAMDPIARSSMWEDLQAGRRTEVDYINGEVVHLAQDLGTTAPVNAALVALIRQAEKNNPGEPWSGPALFAHLKAARP